MAQDTEKIDYVFAYLDCLNKIHELFPDILTWEIIKDINEDINKKCHDKFGYSDSIDINRYNYLPDKALK